MFDRKCGNCYSFPCMREECSRDNVCEIHKFEHEVIIEELGRFEEDDFRV